MSPTFSTAEHAESAKNINYQVFNQYLLSTLDSLLIDPDYLIPDY